MRKVVEVKILSYKSPQRFTVRRTLLAAQNELHKTHPGLQLVVTDVSTLSEIEEFTCAIILPSLVVNEKLVCIGRFPKKDEIISWLSEALEENGRYI
jgi:Thioredoxin domain